MDVSEYMNDVIRLGEELNAAQIEAKQEVIDKIKSMVKFVGVRSVFTPPGKPLKPGEFMLVLRSNPPVYIQGWINEEKFCNGTLCYYDEKLTVHDYPIEDDRELIAFTTFFQQFTVT